MSIKMSITVSTLCCALLGGCSTWNKLDDTEKGGVIGAGSGAVIGNIISPGVGGTVLGGAVGAVSGGVIGHEVEEDKKKH